jgi:hypothetical protein
MTNPQEISRLRLCAIDMWRQVMADIADQGLHERVAAASHRADDAWGRAILHVQLGYAGAARYALSQAAQIEGAYRHDAYSQAAIEALSC